jgi:type IV pilus assembly protein PilV
MEEHVMLQTVLLNKKGLTLVEVMIALVVLLLVFLALMQTALVSIDSNMINALRDEAVNIAEEKMNDERNKTFDNITILACR